MTDGLLTITKSTKDLADWSVTAASNGGIYNGTPYTVSTIASDTLPTGYTYSGISASGSRTDRGTTTVTPVIDTVASWKVFNAAGVDVSELFAAPTLNNGLIVVTPKILTVTGNTENYEFDGTAKDVADPGYTTTATETLGGITYELVAKAGSSLTGGEAIYQGQYDVALDITAATIGGVAYDAVNGNYTLSVTDGLLTIIPAPADYTVRYVVVDDTDTIIATLRTDAGIASMTGATVSVPTPVLEFDGYTRDDASAHNKLTSTVLYDDSLVLTVVYSKRTDLTYTVNYVLTGTGIALAPQKEVRDQTFGTTVSETAIPIIGYAVIAPSTVSLVLDDYGKEITFYYMVNSYIISYQPGTQGTFAPIVFTDVPYGAPTPVPAAGSLTAAAGWAFAGWNIAVSATVTGSAVYVAQWTQATVPPGITPPPPFIPATPVAPNEPGTVTVPAITPTTTITTPATLLAEPETETEPTRIVDMTPPLAAPIGAWALINLILAALAFICLVALVIHAFTGRRKSDAKSNKYETTENDEDDKRRSGIAWRIIGIVAGIASPILFFLTEDITLPMILVDSWTLWMLLITVVQLVAVIVFWRVRKIEDEEDAQETQ